MAFVPTDRHLLRAKDLADARDFEPLGVDDLARAAGLSTAPRSRPPRSRRGSRPASCARTGARNAARFEKTACRRPTSFGSSLQPSDQEELMIKIANVQLWVHDQDEALAFYTQKIGLRCASMSRSPRWATSAGLRAGLPGSPTCRSS